MLDVYLAAGFFALVVTQFVSAMFFLKMFAYQREINRLSGEQMDLLKKMIEKPEGIKE